MFKRMEDDLTDEINPYETVITTSTMTTWQLDCLDIRISVPIIMAVWSQNSAMFLILTHRPPEYRE